MSNRPKRKPSRRARKAGATTVVPTAPTAPAEPPVPVETAAPPDPAPTVHAVFTPSTKNETKAIALEQRFITHDLRRLGIQLGFLAAALVTLGVLDAQTDVIGKLGRSLFSLWG